MPLILFTLLSAGIKAQDYQLSIPAPSRADVDRISEIVSVQHVRSQEVEAYANEREYQRLRAAGYYPKMIKKLKEISLSKSTDDEPWIVMAPNINELDLSKMYPTYEVYQEWMEQIPQKYPELATLEEVGTSAEGRKILAIRIASQENIPMRAEVLITSTIHGDETTGYILCMRLIEDILENAESDGQISGIIKNTILYINPLANPDGTYHGGNHTVEKAQRYNANNEDLNRNFPIIGELDNRTREPETKCWMDFADKHHFVLSMNIHGGDETFNYPWDSFYDQEYQLPDKEWFEEAGREYVELARQSNSQYMKSVNQEGYVYGSEWYKVKGGRQDWMMYEKRCREVTLEVSNVKTSRIQLINQYWEMNRKALLNYIEKANQGIAGTVTDLYGNPLKAEIIIRNHDKNHSSVFTDDHGTYFRPLLGSRSYDVCAYSDGYITECELVDTEEKQLVELHYVLMKGESEYPETGVEKVKNLMEQMKIEWQDNALEVSCRCPIKDIAVSTTDGKILIHTHPNAKRARIDCSKLQKGIYIVIADNGGNRKTKKIYKK
ncbi:MAG: succinylglutamate desuccinylase/aspartoacylase family protein [Bacteroidales bacterium]|nr:succinylglutamate desuccinylase/aspartoacylase family protein [Bacteroidales bacterium]